MSVDAAAQRTTTRRSSHAGPRAVPVLLGLLLAVVLSGCGLSGGSDEAASTPQEDAVSDASGGAQPHAGEGGAEGGSGGERAAGGVGDVAGGDAPAAPGDRKIRRGEVTIEVDDLSKAAGQVRDRAAALGGYVSDESIGLAAMSQPYHGWPEDGSTSSDVALAPYYGPGEGRLVVRVPTTGMRAAMDELAAIGTELNRWSTETEVETALVDLESRVETQTASVARLRALLEQATSLSDVVTLEKELTEREADLESLEAQLASLAGRAAMATITVVLRTPDRAAQVDDASGFLGGLRAGWHALTQSTAVLLTVLGAVLPFAVVAGIVAVPLIAWRRRTRAARRAASASAGSAPAEPA